MAMAQLALGMVETRGLTAAIEAADAMTKAAEVTPVSYTHLGYQKIDMPHFCSKMRSWSRNGL